MPKLSLKPADYDRLDKVVGRTGTEYYSVVSHKVRGRWVRSIHVFARQPSTKELVQYENQVSKLKMRGNRTDVEGSQTLAAKHLYDALIARAYDVPVGWQILGEVTTDEAGNVTAGKPLSREEAVREVPSMIKREAVRDSLGEHYSEARISDMEGDEEDVKGEKSELDD